MSDDTEGTSRRSFLQGIGLAAGAAGLVSIAEPGHAKREAAPEPIEGVEQTGSGARAIELQVNGKRHRIEVEPRTTLLRALREQLSLTGAKSGCDRGACGACTVMLGGRAVAGCMTLAVEAVGQPIVTVEGVASDAKWATLIDAFVEHDAAQCGFCIPGMVVRSAALIEAKGRKRLSREQVQQGLSGNICRCGTYPKIFEAVQAATRRGQG